MDSYGIHMTQMAADTAASHVAAVNESIQLHNKGVLSDFQKKEGSETTTTNASRSKERERETEERLLLSRKEQKRKR